MTSNHLLRPPQICSQVLRSWLISFRMSVSHRVPLQPFHSREGHKPPFTVARPSLFSAKNNTYNITLIPTTRFCGHSSRQHSHKSHQPRLHSQLSRFTRWVSTPCQDWSSRSITANPKRGVDVSIREVLTGQWFTIATGSNIQSTFQGSLVSKDSCFDYVYSPFP